MSQAAVEQRRKYRKQRNEEFASEIPKIIRKVTKIDGDSLTTFASSKKPTSVDPRGTPKSIGSLDSMGSGNMSMGSQDAIIEQLRQKHKQIVSEGR